MDPAECPQPWPSPPRALAHTPAPKVAPAEYPGAQILQLYPLGWGWWMLPRDALPTGCFAPLCPKLPLSPEIPWSPSLQSSVLAKCLLWRAEYCSCCQCLMFIGHRLWICAYICMCSTVFTPNVTGFTCWFGYHDLQGIRSQGSPKFSCCLWSLVLLSCVGGSKEEARVRVPGLRTGPKPPFFVI